jgi:hypothetical protein
MHVGVCGVVVVVVYCRSAAVQLFATTNKPSAQGLSYQSPVAACAVAVACAMQQHMLCCAMLCFVSKTFKSAGRFQCFPLSFFAALPVLV